MNLAIVDDNPEELQKLYKTIMDYSRTHDVAIACDCFATSAAFLSGALSHEKAKKVPRQAADSIR